MPDFAHRLRETRWGVALSLLTIFFGFSLGGAFGIAEDSLKGRLAASAAASLELYGGDESKSKAVVDKSWAYLKRAHLHGGAIGAVALGCTLLLASLSRPSRRVRGVLSGVLGGAGLAYSIFWLVAGFRAPGLGGTGAAKESLAWLGMPSSGLLLVGLLTVIVLALTELFGASRETASNA